MKDKQHSKEDLQFTKEHRQQVFERLHQMKEPKRASIVKQKFMPVTVSLAILGICVLLFMPAKISEPRTNNDIQTAGFVAQQPLTTTLVTVKSKAMEDRVYLNILLTYNKDRKLLKAVSLPSDTYASVEPNIDNGGYYKLLAAYQFGGSENVRDTVSKLLNTPIEQYAVIDIEALAEMLPSIEYELSESVRVRGVTEQALQFEQGKQQLNAEQVVALLMAATEGNTLPEQHFTKLLQAVIEQGITAEQLQQHAPQIETNIAFDTQSQFDIDAIQHISLKQGIQADSKRISRTEGEFFYKFSESYLQTITAELLAVQ